jgi:hypothetical protein
LVKFSTELGAAEPIKTNARACVQVRTPIEPLVGLLRHPTSECQRPDRLEYVDIAHDTPLDQVPESGAGTCTQMAQAFARDRVCP